MSSTDSFQKALMGKTPISTSEATRSRYLDDAYRHGTIAMLPVKIGSLMGVAKEELQELYEHTLLPAMEQLDLGSFITQIDLEYNPAIKLRSEFRIETKPSTLTYRTQLGFTIPLENCKNADSPYLASRIYDVFIQRPRWKKAIDPNYTDKTLRVVPFGAYSEPHSPNRKKEICEILMQIIRLSEEWRISLTRHTLVVHFFDKSIDDFRIRGWNFQVDTTN